MNKKQKLIFGIILSDLSILLILILISSSYSAPSNMNDFLTTSIIKSTTSNISTKNSTTTITTTETVDNIITTATNTSKTTTSKINSTQKTTTEVKDKVFYYGWNLDEDTDFTRRNCLFIFDSNKKIIEGEVELIYFDKYKKIQKVNIDLDTCFLEDKNSIKVNAIIVNGVRYDKIVKK